MAVASIGSDGSALLRYPATAAASVALQHDLSLHDRLVAARSAAAANRGDAGHLAE